MYRFNKNGTRRLPPCYLCEGYFTACDVWAIFLFAFISRACPLLGFISQGPANHSFHIPLPEARVFLPTPLTRGNVSSGVYASSTTSAPARHVSSEFSAPGQWPWLLGSGSTISFCCPSILEMLAASPAVHL